MEILNDAELSEWKRGSIKLCNSAEYFFLRLAAAAVCEVSSQRDSDFVLFTRKAMMRCIMACNLDGRWEVEKFFPNFYNIVSK